MAKKKEQVISEYMSTLGRLGGQVTGPAKARTSEQARKAVKKRWKNLKTLSTDMERATPTEFIKPPSATDFRLVKVKLSNGAVLGIYDWIQLLAGHAGIKHPTKDMHLPPLRAGVLRFRMEDGVWTTYGKVRFAFYSAKKLQVRATADFRPTPDYERTFAGAEEISFLLDECGVVIPALLKSFADCSYKPLEATNLFTTHDRLPKEPGHGCYTWTERGLAR